MEGNFSKPKANPTELSPYLDSVTPKTPKSGPNFVATILMLTSVMIKIRICESIAQKRQSTLLKLHGITAIARRKYTFVRILETSTSNVAH